MVHHENTYVKAPWTAKPLHLLQTSQRAEYSVEPLLHQGHDRALPTKAASLDWLRVQEATARSIEYSYVTISMTKRYL